MNSSLPTLDQWLDYLLSLYREEIDLGLERVRKTASRLRILDSGFKIITVGGTNGKGSTCAFIDHIACEHGIKTGVFSSPHVFSYTERIKINRDNISEDELVSHFAAIDKARDNIKITYYEFGTLAAIKCFVEHGVELAILEVGLGGRLDAVNVWDADVAVISSVGIDHQRYLGNTREEIGFEKAGIFRPGKPAVIGDDNPPASLINHAADIKTELNIIGRDFGCDSLPPLGLKGEFQHKNAACAIVALSKLFRLERDKIAAGLHNTHLAGRLEEIKFKNTKILLDIAHNPHAAKELANYLKSTRPQGKTCALFAMLDDKDIPGVVKALRGEIDCWIITAIDSPRAAKPDKLARIIGEDAQIEPEGKKALMQAVKLAGKRGRVVVFGSIYLLQAISEFKS